VDLATASWAYICFACFTETTRCGGFERTRKASSRMPLSLRHWLDYTPFYGLSLNEGTYVSNVFQSMLINDRRLRVSLRQSLLTSPLMNGVYSNTVQLEYILECASIAPVDLWFTLRRIGRTYCQGNYSRAMGNKGIRIFSKLSC
jgi:hypothetical protein